MRLGTSPPRSPRSAPLAVRAIRTTMREGLAERARAAMERELAEQQKLWPTADFAEGVQAAAERRTAGLCGPVTSARTPSALR